MIELDWAIVSTIVFVMIFVFLGAGFPVAVALGAVGITSTFLFLHGKGMGIIGYAAWEMSNSFVLGSVPLFIFMGQLLLHSGISQRLYEGSTALMGKTKGGLLQTNIFACAIFATISGSSVATAATVGYMAIPEMEKRGYDRKMTMGSLAAGGTLGILIPPSTPLIIYGVLVEQSIGQLFIAGIIPGIVLALLFMAYIWLQVAFRPELAPSFEPMPWRERLGKVMLMWPIFVIMMVVLVGIYAGIVTPAESAAVGASIALVFAAAFRKLTWPVLWSSLLDTVRSTSMLLFIMVGASIVSGTLGLMRVPDQLSAWVVSLNMAPVMVLMAIYGMYLFLGCFIDTVSMVVLTIPVVYPIILKLGYDPIWFGIALVMLVEMAMITPPVGLNLFTIQGIRPDQPLSDVIKGSMPFLIMMFVGLAILTIFPELATWLPSTMKS
ncbi:MAG: TRAP transporter large permease [Proteobacteria bacterium]|nr:TRAP transporter large permease [Pseudomonadota bacterium]